MSIVFEAANPVRRRSSGALWLIVLSVLGLIGAALIALLVKPNPESGELYFTTFKDSSLFKVGFHYADGRPDFGPPAEVARLPAADGAVFEPDGKVAVGGQGSGDVLEVDPSSGAVARVASGCAGAYDIALSPSGQTLYTGGLPGDLCALPTDPLGPGHKVALHGDDTQVADLAFDQTGKCWYTTGVVSGSGNFGILDLATGTTTRELSGSSYARGLAFDPYTKTLFVFGGTGILQIDPRNPQKVLSTMTVPGVQLDNGTADGRGHLYVASNFGQIVVVDYHVSGLLGDTRNVVTDVHLKNYLDDVVPLIGPGAAAPAARRFVGYGAIGFGALLLLSLLYRYAPTPRLASQLPSWDIRRREADARRRNARRISQRKNPSGGRGR